MKRFLLLTLLFSFNLAAQTQAHYAILRHAAAANTAGGTCTAASFNQRPITEEYVAQSWVSVAANQFTLDAGTYRIFATANGYDAGSIKMQLYNVTDAAVPTGGQGAQGFNDATTLAMSPSFVTTQVTIATSKVFEIRWICGITKTTTGWGNANNLQSADEVYLFVEIEKLL